MHLCHTKACRTDHKVTRRLLQVWSQPSAYWHTAHMGVSGAGELWRLTLLDAAEGIWILRLISSNVGRAQKWCQWCYPGLAEDKWIFALQISGRASLFVPSLGSSVLLSLLCLPWGPFGVFVVAGSILGSWEWKAFRVEGTVISHSSDLLILCIDHWAGRKRSCNGKWED